MSLRLRIALAAGVAVALTVVALATAVYAATRSELRGQIDHALTARAQPFTAGAPDGQGGGSASAFGRARRPVLLGSKPNPRLAGGLLPGQGLGPPRDLLPIAPGLAPGPRSVLAPGSPSGDPDRGAGLDRPLFTPPSAAPQAYGGASGYVQFVLPDGRVRTPRGTTSSLPADARSRAIAASSSGRQLIDEKVNHVHLRVLTVGRGSNAGAVQAARPLTEVDHVLRRLLLVVAIAGVAGIGLAAVLGALVARTALAPIARFTRRTERIAAAPDLSERLEVEGRDELARLAQSFNTTLVALERSVAAQRHLVVDASHELRTPIASLRANIQVLEDADRLPAADLAALRADIIAELDELTELVADVVELARGARPHAGRDDVRLDEIIQSLAERVERRGGTSVSLELELEPTLLPGEADRISRAVSNVLDNARKWSPPGGVIEVTLADGTLRVRDHGPGFEEHELPHVFDRFYRADAARGKPGSGLGLAIVLQAAEDHGGFVRAANAPGGGAVIELTFGPTLGAGEQPVSAAVSGASA